MAGKPQRGLKAKRRRTPSAKQIVRGNKKPAQSIMQTPPVVPPAAEKPFVYLPPPPHLDKIAKERWRVMSQRLGAKLTVLDEDMFNAYCQAYSLEQRSYKELAKSGFKEVMKTKAGAMYRNPWHDIHEKAWKSLSQFSAMFGFSPHDRGALKEGAPDPTVPKHKNAFEGF